MTNGTLQLIKGQWLLSGDPDVLRAARNRWPQLSIRGDAVALPADPHTSYQLSYFADEYEIDASHNDHLIGELTWTEEEINQCIGRVDRDGQEHPVTAYILTSDAGLDPSMLARARLKGEQSAGLLSDDVRQFAERFIGKARSA